MFEIYHLGSLDDTIIATTDGNGIVSTTMSNAPSGCYAVIVVAVDASPLTWDGLTPLNGFNKGNDASPDADCVVSGDGCGGP